MVHALCLAAVQRGMLATDSFIDEHYIGLADSLSRQGTRHFSAVVDADSPFWETHQGLWDAAGAAVAGGETKAPFMLSGLAVLEATNRREHAEALLEMLEHLNSVFAIRRDLVAIRADLARGTVTAPVRLMMETAGLGDGSPLDPETVLGTLLLAGAVDAVAPSWQPHLDAMAGIASGLGLPTFERYAEHLAGVMDAIRAVMRVPGSRLPAGVPSPIFDQTAAPLREAISMAERYLGADPTFRDAWEVHRWGMAGAPEVTARFPAGLVIEVLGKHGHDVGDLADEFYRAAGEQGFAYYDHPDLPYRETDTIGTMLRLYPYSKQTEWHRKVLDNLIGLVEAHVEPKGRVPVWLVGAGEAGHPLLGAGCATIEANLLLGLLAYDPDRFATLVTRSAERLFADFSVRGAGITVNYPRPYLLAVLASLLSELSSPTEERWERVRQEIAAEAMRDRLTPQTAACLALACSYEPTEQLMDALWRNAILKAQSFDGSWAAEPMFFAPNRGGSATWFTSRLLTSAVCYDALESLA